MSKFDKIIGYEDIKAELKRYANVLMEPEKYAKLGVMMPSGILLHGEPGLGKTLMAKCFIEETGCRTFTLRKEKPDGDFVKQIKETYDTVKNEKERVTIIFLDDMDKFANEDDNHKNAEEYVTIQSCIDDCKGSGVFTLATVNDKYLLPDSLLRAGRFDKVIEVANPKGEESEKVIKYFLQNKKVMNNVDSSEIAKIMEGHSCAELENVINEAGIYAGFAGREEIGREDVIRACMRLMFEAPESVKPVKETILRNIAVHEAGHTVVSEMLCPGSVALVSVWGHTGDVGGITKVNDPDGYAYSKDLQEKKVMGMLGGKAAIELMYGTEDVSCNSDLHKVFEMVRRFVDNFCSLGFDAFDDRFSSDYLREKKDRLVASEVDRYYRMSKRIITENRRFFDDVVETLCEHKTITYREIQEIKQRYM